MLKMSEDADPNACSPAELQFNSSGKDSSEVDGGDAPIPEDDKERRCRDKPPEDSEYKMQTAPFDPRFPNTNQTKYCNVSFLDYKRCIKLRGEDYGPCEYFRRVYKSLCPNSWVAKWESQIEEGTFPAQI